ncbi:MAG: hypothetical protein JRI68_05200 [Deltaproteobacteria bacterium]|nr:hypothetical protein [Deltaproteobacteria bacterium]
MRWTCLSACLPLLPSTGCWPFFGPWDDDDDVEPWDSPQAVTPDAPMMGPLEIPHWPPLGESDAIHVEVSDDVGLRQLIFSFRNEVFRSLSGNSASVSVTGGELGEGFGTLEVYLEDTEGASRTRTVEDLLVDLSPPEITLGDTVLGAQEDHLEAWVGDAWVIGKAELTVGAIVVEHDFDDGYPPTLGEAWDYSLVKFSVAGLPQGVHEASLTAFDAAGNETTEPFTLTIDSIAPTVQIVSPPNGTVVTGMFEVTVHAIDLTSGPVWIELTIGGTPAATAVGPQATVLLNAAELTPGPTELCAIAHDEAGNPSQLVTIDLIVQ